jgi:hypothetical protein
MKRSIRKRKGAAASGPPPGHPDLLSIRADEMPWKTTARDFPLEPYVGAIGKLHARGYSYAGISAWLNEQLAAQLGHRRITRGQVYRVYQQWLRELGGKGPGIPSGAAAQPGDEISEAEAQIADQRQAEMEDEERPHQFY